jgi:hypothetical protein
MSEGDAPVLTGGIDILRQSTVPETAVGTRLLVGAADRPGAVERLAVAVLGLAEIARGAQRQTEVVKDLGLGIAVADLADQGQR